MSLPVSGLVFFILPDNTTYSVFVTICDLEKFFTFDNEVKSQSVFALSNLCVNTV